MLNATMGRARNDTDAQRAAGAQRRSELVFCSPLLLEHKDDPRLRAHYRVMMDLDSTWYPLLEAMATRPGGQRVRYQDCPTWESLADLVDGGVPRMLEMFDEVMSFEVMRNHPPLAGAREAAHTMKAHGMELHVMTQRHPRFADDTRRYLDHFGMPYDSLVCDMEHDKLALCRQRGIAVVVDDHPDLLASAHDQGLDALSLHYPYNAAVIGERRLAHAHSWTDLATHVAAAVARRVRAAVNDA